MRRLSSLGSKQLAHRRGRSALTATGIVLGVAILFGVLVANATSQAGVDTLIADFTGRADVLVSPTGAFDATMPEDRVARLARLDGVEAAVGSMAFRSSIDTAATDEPVEVSVRGFRLREAMLLQSYRLVSGRFFAAGERGAVIPKRLAGRLDVAPGATLEVLTPRGIRPVRLTGILDDTGAGRTNQGDAVFVSIETARALSGRGAVVTGARLVLEEGVDVESWIDRNEDALGPGIDFENADTLASGFKDFLAILGTMFTFFAAVTLFVGAFLIYLTLSMAVIERVRIYGTLRALGAFRGQVRRLVLAEAIALGLVSTAAGLALGLAIAKGLLALMANLFEIDLPGLTVGAGSIGAAITLGLVTTLVSALVPARRAARLSPVVAMRGDYAAETRLSRAWIAGLVAAAAGVGIAQAGGASGALATPLIMLGAVLLVPVLLRPLARLIGRLTNRIARGVGDVAVLHLAKERSRSAYTLALVMVVMAMIFAIGGLNASMRRLLDDTIRRQFGADLTISSSAALDDGFERALASVRGVGTVTALRFAEVKLLEAGGDREQMFARVVDPATYFDVAGFAVVEGSERAAIAGLRRGGSVLFPESQASQMGIGPGSRVQFATSRGPADFVVAATYVSFTPGPPELVVGLADGRRYLNVGGAFAFQLNAAEGFGAAEVARGIREQLGARYNLEIETPDAIKADAERQFGQFFNIFYAIIMVAGVVGLLGLANTLAMSVLQRYREIGVLRAIGTTRGQVRRMVLTESATMGLVAFLLAVPLGWLVSVLAVSAMSDAFGFGIDYVYPVSWLPVVAGLGILIAGAAAFAPGRRAARLEVVEALQYE